MLSIYNFADDNTLHSCGLSDIVRNIKHDIEVIFRKWFKLFSSLRTFVMEVFNPLNNINPEFMWSYFTFKYLAINIRISLLLKLPRAILWQEIFRAWKVKMPSKIIFRSSTKFICRKYCSWNELRNKKCREKNL